MDRLGGPKEEYDVVGLLLWDGTNCEFASLSRRPPIRATAEYDSGWIVRDIVGDDGCIPATDSEDCISALLIAFVKNGDLVASMSPVGAPKVTGMFRLVPTVVGSLRRELDITGDGEDELMW